MKNDLAQLESNMQRLIWLVQKLQDNHYVCSVFTVPPEFGGIAKYKVNIKGINGSTVFYLPVSSFNGYSDESLLQFMLAKVKQEKISAYPKKPYGSTTPMKYNTGGSVPSMGVSTPKSLSKLGDLTQRVRMTCCELGEMHTLGAQRFWSTSIQTGIIHLNDKHKWTREQIADWLEAQDVDLTIG